MRKLLATAAALAPLMAATGVQAEVVVSTSRTTPILTSNATGTAADNIRFTNGGGTNLKSGTAITIDSNNNVTTENGSLVNIENAADHSIGLQINGGVSTVVSIGGQILVSDDITEYPDTNKDGNLDGPFANGTDRYGIRLVGTQPVTGTVQIETSGVVRVEGNESYGISVESGLKGNLNNFGAITVVGNNSVGVRTNSAVTGNVTLDGTINATGQNSSAAAINGDVTGRLTLQGTMTSTGYRYTTLGTDDFVSKLDPDDLYQGASTVIVASNVGGGIVFDKPPVANKDNPDVDGDGRADASEGTASITSYGTAPAVTIGSATKSINLGVAGSGDYAYGLINNGAIVGNGIYKNIDANGLRVGVNGGYAVNIAGGISNTGSIATLANEANSVAVRIGAGVITPTFNNSGFITGASSTSLNSTVNAIRIETGANLPSLTNTGVILATAGGGTAAATTVLDLSGTLTSITNKGSIQANVSANAAGDKVTGTTTAIDVRANTTGVNVFQDGVIGTPTAADPDTDGDGVVDSKEPEIFGDIFLGSGADTLDIRNGMVVGNIDFGAGADKLSISGGAVVRGALSNSDGLLDIDVSKGTLDARQNSSISVTNLNVGAEGTLIVTVDPANKTGAGFNVSGTANIATGANLGIRFASLLQNPERFTIIHAGTLNYGAIDPTKIAENSPYLYVVNVGANVAAGDVYIDARRRTASEAGMIKVEGQIIDSFYGALSTNSPLLNAFLSETTRDGFFDLYEQILPDHSGGPLLSLASGVDAVTRALTGRNATAEVGETSAWLQEINFYADKDKTDTYGFRSEGFGVAGGIERGTNYGAFGVSVAFTSSDINDPEAEAEEVLSASLVELGLYWRAQGHNWTTWARAAGGYATFDSKRALVGDGLNLKNSATWNGFTLAVAGGASYERNFGRMNVRPEVYAEYFSLSEDGYTEKGGGDGFDLVVDDRDGHLFSATAAVNIGYGFGANGWIRPELRLGWKQNISVDVGETIARFASGGSSFTLSPNTIEGGGPIAGLRLAVGNDLGKLTIAADAEMLEDYVRYTLLLRASFKF